MCLCFAAPEIRVRGHGGRLAVLARTGRRWHGARRRAASLERHRTHRVEGRDGRKQIVVSASREVVGYDLETGKRLWGARGLGQNTIPQPVAANGVVFVMSGFRDPNLMAIRLGREGDLTGTDAIVWQNQRGNSYSASPVLHDGILYVLTDTGMLSAFDARTGKPHYQLQRLPKPYQFKSSPVGANGKLYLASEDEDVIVVRLGPMFEVLATNTLHDQTFIATPAVVDATIYLRGQNTLFAIR